MAEIRTTCPACKQEIDVVAEQVVVHVPLGGSNAGGPAYGYTCRECQAFVTKPADGQTVRLLLAGGAVRLDGTKPPWDGAASQHPETPDAAARPFTTNDIRDLRALLERRDAIEELRGRHDRKD